MRKERAKSPPGKCLYCDREIKRRGAKMHLDACPQRRTVIQAAGGRGRSETLYHLQVKDRWSGRYWLDLEVPGTAILGDLDAYLRAIWLECCGHMSQFSVGGWRGPEIDMEEELRAVFWNDVELTHIYDFGTDTVSLIRAVGSRQGRPANPLRPIVLMARNTLRLRGAGGAALLTAPVRAAGQPAPADLPAPPSATPEEAGGR